MAGKNQVTLTFAGDADQLDTTVEHVGESTKRMGAGFAKFGRALEKDIGVRVDKVGGGLSLLSQFIGGPFGGALTAGAFALDTVSTALGIVSVANIKAAAGWAAHKAAVVASTVAQWALNAAWLASPIGIVVVALTAMAALFVVLWTRSERFRAIVTGSFAAVRDAAAAAFGWVKRNWPLLLAILTGPIGLAVLAIAKHKDKLIAIFKGVADTIAGAFAAVFQAVRTAWNSTLGGKGFTFGGWDPPGPGSVPGFSLRIPRLHQGGTVPGPPGADVLTILQAGERVTARGQSTGNLVIYGGLHVHANNAHALVEQLQRYAKDNGGLPIKIAG